jgi:hypothetical protein
MVTQTSFRLPAHVLRATCYVWKAEGAEGERRRAEGGRVHGFLTFP